MTDIGTVHVRVVVMSEGDQELSSSSLADRVLEGVPEQEPPPGGQNWQEVYMPCWAECLWAGAEK